MKRRDFLRHGAMALAPLAGCTPPPRTSVGAGSGPPAARVIVVGAGLAGLAAAHELTRAGVEVAVLERAAGKLYHVRGRLIRFGRGGNPTWPFPLSDEEAQLGYSGIWKKYVGDALHDLGDPSTRDWPTDP